MASATYLGQICSIHPERGGERRKDNRRCTGCHNAASKAYRERNKEKVKAYSDAYLPEWRKKNASKIREYGRKNTAKWRMLNSEAVKVKANSPEARSYRSARRAKVKAATPCWSDQFFITEIYDLASRRTKVTGILWQVDHIVPITSKSVCGLHCEANMQVITKTTNTSKGNRHWPNMWT